MTITLQLPPAQLIYTWVGGKIHWLKSLHDNVISAVVDFSYQWYPITATSMEGVCRPQGRPHWKMNHIWSHSMRVLWSYYSDHHLYLPTLYFINAFRTHVVFLKISRSGMMQLRRNYMWQLGKLVVMCCQRRWQGSRTRQLFANSNDINFAFESRIAASIFDSFDKLINFVWICKHIQKNQLYQIFWF